MGSVGQQSRPRIWSRIRRRWVRGHVALAAATGIAVAMLAGHTPGWSLRPRLMPLTRAHANPAAASIADDGSSAGSGIASQSSRVIPAQLQSDAVGQTLPYLVYLPPAYDANPTGRYPVLYLLHGLGGTDTEWYSDGVFDAADRLIRAGDIPPLVIVLPEGKQAYWVDHAGGPRWGAYVAHDLVAEIDGRYRTLADRGHRAIGGMSMGGNGALQLAMNYPGVFGVAGAHSFALRRRDTAPPYFGDQSYFNAHDPLYLFQTRPEVARALTLWLDVGGDDSWRPADEAFHRQLLDEGIAHTWHEYPGGHEDAYWSAHTAEYLRFYATALSGASAGLAPRVSPVPST